MGQIYVRENESSERIHIKFESDFYWVVHSVSLTDLNLCCQI